MKKMLMSFFVLFCMILTGFAYTNWTNNLNTGYADVIEMSQTSKLQSLVVPDGNHLVPQGVLMGKDDVDAVYYTYLLETEAANSVNVSVNEVFFVKNNVKTLDEDGLLCFEFTVNQISTTRVEVHLTIRLNMPENKAQYDLIKGSTVSFSLTFNN